MNPLVTSRCDLIGSNLIRQRLVGKGAAVRIKIANIDALSNAGNPDNLADLAGTLQYIFAQRESRAMRLRGEVNHGDERLLGQQ